MHCNAPKDVSFCIREASERFRRLQKDFHAFKRIPERLRRLQKHFMASQKFQGNPEAFHGDARNFMAFLNVARRFKKI